MTALRLIAAFVVGLTMAPAAGPAMAQAQDYPNKPIRFIAPYNAGGSYDTVARLIGQKLTEKFKQQVVIENRPGAGSLIGTEVAAKAAPDGYTIVIFGNNHGILPAVHTKASFSVQKDFDPVALVATVPALLLVHPGVEAKDTAELIKLAKAKPGQLNFGSGGNGSSTHLGMEMFKAATGTDIVHIPYKAGVPATMDLIAGQTQVGLLDIVSARAHVDAGKLRPLATTTDQRSPFFPNVPTIVEAGVPDYRYVEWYGITVPAGTPRPIIDKLNAAIKEIMSDPSVKERLTGMGATPMASTPEEFATFFDNEIKKNAEAVKRAGVKID
jgi:tripartite-type tricarboxylate transporter receptor subunit TctC